VRRIACLHTAQSNIAIFETARRELGLDIALRHCVRADLFETAEKNGLTHDVAKRTREALRELCADSAAVLLTCSTLGPAAAQAAKDASAPIWRVDQALANAAAKNVGRVVVLCAAEATLAPTLLLFETAARATGAQIEVRLVAGAWAAFKAGDHRSYFAFIAEAADAASRAGAVCVALAQASMAPARILCRASPAPLDSPRAGLTAALAAIAR